MRILIAFLFFASLSAQDLHTQVTVWTTENTQHDERVLRLANTSPYDVTVVAAFYDAYGNYLGVASGRFIPGLTVEVPLRELLWERSFYGTMWIYSDHPVAVQVDDMQFTQATVPKNRVRSSIANLFKEE